MEAPVYVEAASSTATDDKDSESQYRSQHIWNTSGKHHNKLRSRN